MTICLRKRKMVFYHVMAILHAFFLVIAALIWQSDDLYFNIFDMILFSVFPFATLASLATGSNKRNIVEKSKFFNQVRLKNMLQFLYVFGMVCFMLSYIYVYVELIVDRTGRLHTSVFFQSLSFSVLHLSLSSMRSSNDIYVSDEDSANQTSTL